VSVAIAWFRRDLRLTDNPALAEALAAADTVVPVYVHAPEEEGAWRPGAASRWWLHRSLGALDASLSARGSRLVIRRGPTADTLRALARETGASSIHWNRLYEPAIVERDANLTTSLGEAGIHATSHHGHLLFEPGRILTGSGDVDVWGSPTTTSEEVTGSGTVTYH